MENINYIIAFIIIIGFFIFQFRSFRSTREKVRRYKSIFFEDKDEYFYNGTTINVDYSSSTLSTILESINGYLAKNQGAVSDFHLMKDIVDRNTYVAEDEIQTQIPVPIFLGLMGTMTGIIAGILVLIFSGGLDALFTTTDTNAGLEGVKALLGGVGVAMITGIVGILFNTFSTREFRNAKIEVERNKNTFLSWIQAELLPNLSNDTSSALVEMTKNLSNFNNTFSGNTKELKGTLDKINTSYGLQADMIDKISQLDISKTAAVNIELYNKLTSCTDQIGKLGEYLQDINRYQRNTTEVIDKMNQFFDSRMEQIDQVNIELRQALTRFSDSSKNYLQTLQEELDGQVFGINKAAERQQQALQQHFDSLFTALTTALQQQQAELSKHFDTATVQMRTAATEQQAIFREKLTETTALVEELKNLSDIKIIMREMIEQSVLQSQQISELTVAIRKLAEIKAIGGTAGGFKVLMWHKWLLTGVVCILGVSGLVYLLTLIFGLLCGG